MIKKHGKNGIDLLRYAVKLFDSCNEELNERFTAPQLIRIAEAMEQCEWDIYPDQWTTQQLDDCVQFGIVPNWERTSYDGYKPVYKQTGNSVFKISGQYVSIFEVKVIANAKEEAIAWAEGDMPLPKDTEYLNDSLELIK